MSELLAEGSFHACSNEPGYIFDHVNGFNKNFSKLSYCSTDHKNCIENCFEHSQSKLLDLQQSVFDDMILGSHVMMLSKNGFHKSWSDRLAFTNEKNRKIGIIFDIEK